VNIWLVADYLGSLVSNQELEVRADLSLLPGTVLQFHDGNIYDRIYNPGTTEVWTDVSVTRGVTPAVARTYISAKSSVLMAFRVNFSLNATKLPDDYSIVPWDLIAGNYAKENLINMENRGSALTYHSDDSSYERYFYPMYKHVVSPARSLSINLRPDLGLVSHVQLLGYKIVHAPDVGVQSQHESRTQDWYALRFKELSGKVQSNNPTADGAVHILHAGTGHDNVVGTTELVAYEPKGITDMAFTPRNLPRLSVEITDRDGRPARLGRVHVWLRVFQEVGLIGRHGQC
jgi:hypothetical protein